LSDYCEDGCVVLLFQNKIVLQKEVKLKEFNFKLLHGILACNANLFRWKIKISSACDVCGESQTIEHLLWSCRYVKPLWRKVETIYSLSLNYRMILGIEATANQNFALTMIGFLIYKEWLLLSLQNKARCKDINFDWYKEEISLRLKIFKLCKSFDMEEVEYLAVLMNLL